jgi:hypothetical protein
VDGGFDRVAAQVIESDAPDQGEVARGLFVAREDFVFTKGPVERPMPNALHRLVSSRDPRDSGWSDEAGARHAAGPTTRRRVGCIRAAAQPIDAGDGA